MPESFSFFILAAYLLLFGYLLGRWEGRRALKQESAQIRCFYCMALKGSPHQSFCTVAGLVNGESDCETDAVLKTYHCPGCECSEDSDPDLTNGTGITIEFQTFQGDCTECWGLKGLPHWPRCHRQGIVTEADCKKEPHA